jgi:hypothetical protein
MMPDLSSAPRAVLDLAEWLSERGISLQARSFHSASNQLLQAHAPQGTVQVLADRGQWFIELAPPGTEEFFGTAAWSSCLAGAEVSLELEPLSAQVAWIKEYLAGDAHGGINIECLRQARRRRAYGRMGLTW